MSAAWQLVSMSWRQLLPARVGLKGVPAASLMATPPATDTLGNRPSVSFRSLSSSAFLSLFHSSHFPLRFFPFHPCFVRHFSFFPLFRRFTYCVHISFVPLLVPSFQKQ
jgi:hypothetical protein